MGTLINAYIAGGGAAWGVKAGQCYADVGMVHGYRAALQLLSNMNASGPSLSRVSTWQGVAEHPGSH